MAITDCAYIIFGILEHHVTSFARKQASDDGITDVDGSPLDIKEKFDPWVEQSGFPLLFVHWDYESGNVTLTQSHYNPKKDEMPPSPFE